MYQPPQWQHIDHTLQERLDDCAGDTERQLDVLRRTQQEQTFHLLAMDLQGMLPLEKLSDHLSDLADLMLRHVLALCWSGARKRSPRRCEIRDHRVWQAGRQGAGLCLRSRPDLPVRRRPSRCAGKLRAGRATHQHDAEQLHLIGAFV